MVFGINFLALLVSIALCLLAGTIGSIFNIKAIPNWYAKLKKSKLNPPGFVFGPVWTILYLMMAISLYLVWITGGKSSSFNLAIILFLIQLFLNVIWSYLFFGIRKPLFAFYEIILLWIFILLTIISFFQFSKAAAYLLLPYLFWVSFASYLNYSVWKLNRNKLK